VSYKATSSCWQAVSLVRAGLYSLAGKCESCKVKHGEISVLPDLQEKAVLLKSLLNSLFIGTNNFSLGSGKQ